MKQIVLEVNNLVSRYRNSKRKVLDDVSLKVNRGDFVAIVGPNGSGKSTIFKTILGEIRDYSGNVLYEGVELSSIDLKERAKKIAVVQQRNQTIENFTVREVISMGRTPYHGIFSNYNLNDQKVIDNALYLTGLQDLQNEYCNQISGGQLQRVWLALALAQEPELILLDEPTTYLDVKYQIQLMEMVRELVDNHGITCLAILHDLNQVLNYADYVFIIKKGKIYKQGSTDSIINSENLKEVFEVNAEVIDSIGDRKVLDLYLDKEDKYVHYDIKHGKIRQI